MKAVTISETYQDKKAFLARLNVALAEIGYHPQSQAEGFMTYKPSFQAGLLAGKISVQMEDSSCTIVGSNTYIKKLQKRLKEEKPQLKESSSVTPQPAIIFYAGFWRRFVAALIDTIILGIGGAIIGGIIGAIIGFVLGASGTDIGTIRVIAGVIGYIIGIVLNWLYFTLLESSSKQATLGKMAIGIIVTDLNASRISFGKANGRYWGKIVSAIILSIGFIMAGFTQKKQALDDIMAGTLVVKK